MEFEWDADKAVENLRKHKVAFLEAATAFGDFLSATAPDPAHSAGEERYITVGLSSSGGCSWSRTPGEAAGFALSALEP